MASIDQPVILLDTDEVVDAQVVCVDTNQNILGEPSRHRGRKERSEQRTRNNNKKSASVALGKKEFDELMQLAEYEVTQDPYRGIGFLNRENNSNGSENSTMVDVDGEDTGITPSCSVEKKGGKIITPWDICQWGILSMPKNNEKAILDDKETGDSLPLDVDDAQNLVQNLTESCCPSILAWTKEHLEEERRKKQQSEKNNKKRGKKRGRSSCEQVGNNAPVSSKFPDLGIRPSGMNYQSPCDSNPFCLGSMGGIMNDLLKERCQRSITCTIIDEDDKSADIGNQSKDLKQTKIIEYSDGHDSIKNKKKNCAEIEIVDVDQDTNMGAAAMESEESDSVFAFMGGSETPSNLGGKAQNTGDEKPKNNVTTPTAAITTCKRLGPRWTMPAKENPAEVFSSEDASNNHYFDEESYSQTTKDEINKLRRSESIDDSHIKKFIQNMFERLEKTKTTEMTIDVYMQIMTEWHKSLIFVNPFIQEQNVPSDKITIALPPGIQNLGATCYLNTQLQCLAQIPVFLDGIFSWRPVNATHKMNGVMTKLQKLLAQLLVGGDCKYTSLDFSNALGIQHNEQQDPNEFARLLFDRMEESFQQCSSTSSVAGDGHLNGRDDLGMLLQRIFHGTTTYETCCLKCGYSSKRSEGFMDLNLPIVHRQDSEEDEDENNIKSKQHKKGPIDKAFAKQKKKSSGGTDVQYCFDQYKKAEILDGDNQYFCEACNCKQDAKRVMSLTELPPVLNIQLSRYVFDRKKFIKKKLTDKVRLPTILTINHHGGRENVDDDSPDNDNSTKSVNSEKKYLLCAVMRHQGTSAYSGHYIAEAMDWTTGQFYEFNDETVKVLSAPSNSYVPNNFLNSKDNTVVSKTNSVGSQDAYNMYYIDEEYLGKNAIATMQRNQRLISTQNRNNKIRNDDDIEVLSDLTRENNNRYSMLTELCCVDYQISDRLRRRKEGIRKYMFVDPSSLLLQEGQRKTDDEPYYWVDGENLRKFLKCDRSLDEKLKSDEPIVCPNSLVSPNGFLHPRVARRGKLLRKSLYDSYVSLLSGERKLLSGTNAVRESDVTGSVITSEKGIGCEEYSKSYQSELSEKLEFLKSISSLYQDILDDTTNSAKISKSDLVKDDTQEEYSYIVARSMLTRFKKLVEDLMKSVAGFTKGGCADSTTTKSDSKFNVVLNGIDDLDLSSFPGNPTHIDCTAAKETKNERQTEFLDEKLNSKITCSHGKCKEFNQRVVRYFPYKVWAKVKKVFPKAIEHKVLMFTVNGEPRKPNNEEDGCIYCQKEKDAIKTLTSDVERWAKETKVNSALKKLLNGKKISLGEIAFHNFDSAQNNCRLVHRDDIGNFCKSVKKLSSFSRLKKPDQSKIKAFVENIVFPSYHSVVLDFEKQPNARLLQSIRSLICCEHKRVIKSAIIDTFGDDVELQGRHQISNSVAVLSEEEYDSYINALAELQIILNCDHQEAIELRQKNSLTLVDDVKKYAASCHPVITSKAQDNTSSDEVLLFSLGGDSKEFSIVPGICDHEKCKKEFEPAEHQKVNGINVENVSVDSMDNGEEVKNVRRKSDCKVGSIAMQPIVVESDIEDYVDVLGNTNNIRVFQYMEDSNLPDALGSLKTILGLPNSDNNEGLSVGSLLGSLRRSTRRRKTKFPIGCITDECKIGIGFHHNVAALRLLLFQNCQIPLGCKLSIAIFADGDSSLKSVEIAFDSSEETLKSLIDQSNIMDESTSKLLESKPSEHFFLLYQDDKNGQDGEIETTLMDSLLQISNIESSDSKGKNSEGAKKRKRSSERGFQGSLLHSSTSSCLVDEKNSGDGNDSCHQIESDSNNVEKRPRLNTLISDDDTDETEPQNKMAESNITSVSSDEEVSIIPSPRQRIAPDNDDQQMKFVRKLMEFANSKDEIACFEAISWVCEKNPEYTEAEIIGDALTRLFQNA